MASNGLARLIAISQLKSNNANDAALQDAENQQSLVDVEKQGDITIERLKVIEELQEGLSRLSQTLSPPAAALLDEWLELAAIAMQ